MNIGIEFDKTLIHYDPLLHQLACARELIPESTPVTIQAVKAALLKQDLEADWLELQSEVLGEDILLVKPYAGAVDFFRMAHEQSITLTIISEKPRHPPKNSDCDLHVAVHKWLDHYGFTSPEDINLSPEMVFLELSDTDKLQRIAALGCDFFIDNDFSFLDMPGFPMSVRRILFDPIGETEASPDFKTVSSWLQLQKMLLRS